MSFVPTYTRDLAFIVQYGTDSYSTHFLKPVRVIDWPAAVVVPYLCEWLVEEVSTDSGIEFFEIDFGNSLDIVWFVEALEEFFLGHSGLEVIHRGYGSSASWKQKTGKGNEQG